MKKTISYLFASAGLLTVLALGSCSKSESLPAIDGYNSSNDVAKANLVAHWTFDGTNNEAISSTAPTKTYGTVGFATGQIGQALQLTKGALVYPAITGINGANALNNFTVSMWVNVNDTGKGGVFTSLFGIIPTGVTDIWGDVMMDAETGRHLTTSDTLELHPLLNTHPVGGGNSLQDNVATIDTGKNLGAYFMGAKKWSHFVARWDGTTHQYFLFANGASVGAYTDRGTTGVEIMAVPVQAVFGSLASSDIGFAGAPVQQTWNPWATAMIDDVRVYNTALADKDVTALYDLGKAGR